MLCVNCGAREAEGGPLCRQCTAALLVVREGKKQRIEVCPKCSSIHVGGKWYSADSTAPLARLLASSFHFENASHVRVDEASLDLGSSTIRGRATATVKGVDVSLDLEREVFVARVSCPVCNRVTGSYYESILQIRTYSGSNRKLLEEALSVVEETVSARSSDPSSFISKVEWLPEGVDIYMGRKNDGQRAAAALRSRYVSTVRVSKRLAGYREGREFHRFTYSVRILDLSRGTAINMGGKHYLVSSISGSAVHLVNTGDWREEQVAPQEFFTRQWEQSSVQPERRRGLVLARRQGETDLMDMSTYRVVTARGEAQSDEVEYIVFREQAYII